MRCMFGHPGIPGEPFVLRPTDRAIGTGKKHRRRAKPPSVHFILGLDAASCFRTPNHQVAHAHLHPRCTTPAAHHNSFFMIGSLLDGYCALIPAAPGRRRSMSDRFAQKTPFFAARTKLASARSRRRQERHFPVARADVAKQSRKLCRSQAINRSTTTPRAPVSALSRSLAE